MALATLCVGACLITTVSSAAAILKVPADFATIQGAINASTNGDTIRISAGLYVEQLTIKQKSITLEGVPGATIRASDSMIAQLGFGTVFLVGVDRCPNVVLRGLTVDGDRLGDAYTQPGTGLSGIVYLDSGGLVEDCEVRGFRLASQFGGFGWVGFAATNTRITEAPEVKVLRSRFLDNGVGIHIRGNDTAKSALRVKFLVQDCVVEGGGPSLGDSQIGMLFSCGASGTVLGNRITGHCRLVNDTEKSLGILAVDWMWLVGLNNNPVALLPIRYESNTLIANEWAIGSVKSDSSVFLNNLIIGPTSPDTFANPAQIVTTGISVTGSGNILEGNSISHVTRGILLMGDDPEFGKVLGVAQNPTVVSNRFCEVKNRFIVEPLATGTETNSLDCPVNPPAIEIGQAVALNWLVSGEPLILETATVAEGPWTVTDQNVSSNGKTTTVFAKASGKALFYRLRKR